MNHSDIMAAYDKLSEEESEDYLVGWQMAKRDSEFLVVPGLTEDDEMSKAYKMGYEHFFLLMG